MSELPVAEACSAWRLGTLCEERWCDEELWCALPLLLWPALLELLPDELLLGEELLPVELLLGEELLPDELLLGDELLLELPDALLLGDELLLDLAALADWLFFEPLLELLALLDLLLEPDEVLSLIHI